MADLPAEFVSSIGAGQRTITGSETVLTKLEVAERDTVNTRFTHAAVTSLRPPKSWASQRDAVSKDKRIRTRSRVVKSRARTAEMARYPLISSATARVTSVEVLAPRSDSKDWPMSSASHLIEQQRG